MARKVRNYNQSTVTAVFNGTPIQGLMEGASYTVEYLGGGVETTEGTDGPGLNQATPQGGKITITIQEGSPSNAMLLENRRRQLQDVNAADDSLVIYSGVQAVFTLGNCLLSTPGELTSGDKKMGGRQYTFIGTDLTETETAPA